MGGGGSRCHCHASRSYHAVARNTPQAAQIAALQRQLKEAKDEATKRQDPKYYREMQKKVFDEYLERINPKVMTYLNPIDPVLQKARNVMIIGEVSCGKSSLLNKLFGLNLPVGVGHITESIESVYNNGSAIVWDTPGCNEDLAFYNEHNLNFVHSMTFVIILYKGSLSTVSPVVRAVLVIKGISGFACVRTQCDLFSVAGHRQALTLDQEMDRDKEALQEMGVPELTGGTRFFYRTATAEGAPEFDNEDVKNLILGTA